MLLACAALIGSLCVPPEFVSVSQFSSMIVSNEKSQFDSERSHRTGIEIVAWSSDMIEEALSNGMDRVCDRGWCVHYRKHCSEDGRFCAVSTSAAEHASDSANPLHLVVVNTGFQIHAPSRATMQRIMGRLGYVLHAEGGRPTSVMHITRFDRESMSITGGIGCLRSVWVEGCPRPEFPQFPRPAHL